jgi:hypothetical protein
MFVPTVYRKDILHIWLSIHSRDIWISRKRTVESSNISTCQMLPSAAGRVVVVKPNQTILVEALHPIPAFEESFSRAPSEDEGRSPISFDNHPSKRFPEAIPLRNIKATNSVNSLTKYFMLFGLYLFHIKQVLNQ